MSSGGYTHGGVIVGPQVSPEMGKKVRARAIAHAVELARVSKANKLSIWLHPLSETSLQAIWGVNPLLEHGFSDTSTHVWIVDLRESLDLLWSRLSTNVVRDIKKARSAGYRVERCSVTTEFKSLLDLHERTYARNSLPPRPLGMLSPLPEVLEPSGNFGLWRCVSAEGEVVGYHGATLFGTTGYYHIGCCLDEHLRQGINPLLFWTAMEELKRAGYRWYDLGVAVPFGEGKALSLSEFKRKFGAVVHRSFSGNLAIEVAKQPQGEFAEQATPSAANPGGIGQPIGAASNLRRVLSRYTQWRNR
ncbi:acetyltransferase (GNAT) family protein [Bradyrhizobium macuxiense]|uniref:Acetyltransferase (GNAT) family protein n=2 Tax=Bradyrhizobium macuxiense TaxID=1755647 RepID=A0A560LN37_9BRAD|nr:acetyltransferase (GNAT) family protein [Bradyrhizobium macuxiense]